MVFNIKHFAALTLFFALMVAVLNIYMNLVLRQSSPDFQLPISVDHDLFGFHQPEVKQFPDVENHRPQSIVARNVKFGSLTCDNGKLVCEGICPHAIAKNTNQSQYVDSLIATNMKDTAFPSFDYTYKKSVFERNLRNISRYEAIWEQMRVWTKNRILIPRNQDLSLFQVALARAPIISADLVKKGVQPKLLLTLKGGQKALFKPRRYDLDTVFTNSPYEGADRHNGEIVAFHLTRLLILNRGPFVVGRRLNFIDEIVPVASDALKAAIFKNQTSPENPCFYQRSNKCHYCTKQYGACTESGGFFDGAMILWLSSVQKVTTIRSQWARTYRSNEFAKWEKNACHCLEAKKHAVLGNAPYFLDIMDASVLDFLIGNADRHRYDVISEPVDLAMIILLDNGKSFGNPDRDEITILAPLYQCCQIRRKTYEVLKYFGDVNLAHALEQPLRSDPLFPKLLSVRHMKAINRRLAKLLVLVDMCIVKHGDSHVLVKDGFS